MAELVVPMWVWKRTELREVLFTWMSYLSISHFTCCVGRAGGNRSECEHSCRQVKKVHNKREISS